MLHLHLSQTLGEAEIAAWTTPEERAAAAAFAPRRRDEWLSWRAVVRRELGHDVRIDYNALGAPCLPDGEACLSVSHCRGSIAVALAERPCAVDIETLARDFRSVAPRYLIPEEQMLSDDSHWLAVAWCAKETLYKYAGRRELDLLLDLRIEKVDFRTATLVGRICGEAPLTLRFLLLADRVVVWLS